ncbi:hypothetical protein [Halanaerobium congolense]|uniref:hypothetical protein n=1 Tax=Halanaerobium congolense TaxID=54121 RepID=UPI0010ECD449|nr:hypothetical protein [Halanaerobium congolense]TDP26822.1 hypothetical protein C8C79_10219 [Halanaerobium congolense]
MSKTINWAWLLYLVIKLIIEKHLSAADAANMVASKNDVGVDELLKIIPEKYL